MAGMVMVDTVMVVLAVMAIDMEDMVLAMQGMVDMAMASTLITDMARAINNNRMGMSMDISSNHMDKVRVISNKHTIRQTLMPHRLILSRIDNLKHILNQKLTLNHSPMLKRTLKHKHILSPNHMIMLQPILNRKPMTIPKPTLSRKTTILNPTLSRKPITLKPTLSRKLKNTAIQLILKLVIAM